MKVLITGFDPFGGEKINPAWEAVNALPNEVDGVEVIKVQIPTVFKKSAQKLFEAIESVKPDAVICVGQAGGRFDFNVERVAINVDDARIPDNEGKQPIDVKIFEDGENAYFATLPIKAMVEEAKKAGVPASVSNTAGTFVCNHIMYSLLYYINKNKLNIRGGFIHVPYISQQVIGKKNTPYMELTTATKGLEASVRAIKNNLVDLKVTGGKEC
ncbi:MAG TPA: pyroglutamyl-peptidase I [Candidatus Aphodousia faecipullorum]|nr:pyroglutamyl-peptidase I [Candidatus Aphodousia faecipullorum]